MPEVFIEKHYSDKKFHSKKDPIFMQKCEDEGCQLNGDFRDYIILNYDNIVKILKKHEKSVDRIIFAKKVKGKKITVMLCELTKGKKTQQDVLEKTRKSGEYIIKVFEKYGFNVVNFDCIYLGKYKNPKRIKKSKKFSIPGCHRNDLKIRQFNCGTNISSIKNLNIIS